MVISHRSSASSRVVGLRAFLSNLLSIRLNQNSKESILIILVGLFVWLFGFRRGPSNLWSRVGTGTKAKAKNQVDDHLGQKRLSDTRGLGMCCFYPLLNLTTLGEIVEFHAISCQMSDISFGLSVVH